MADYAQLTTTGGQKTAAVAAGGGTADVVVSALPGRVSKIMFSAAGTAALELYDHASASSGAKLVWKSAATPAAGDYVDLDLPLGLGLVAKQVSGTGACTIYYTEDGVSGGGASDKATRPLSYGGQNSSAHAAGAGGASAALAASGRLCRVVVLSSGTAATDIYDNASAASGTKLLTVKGSPTIGTVIDVQAPAANGIFVGGATNTSQLLVTYVKNAAFGR